jgi:hypothetical protein
MVTKCKMPPELVLEELPYCQPVMQTVQGGVNRAADIAAFEDLVISVRQCTKAYGNESHSIVNFLVARFSEKMIKKHDKRNLEWVYDILHPDFGTVEVCKYAYCAMHGIKLRTLEYIQDLVREGHVAQMASGDVKKQLTLKDAFMAFKLDIDFYHAHIANFMDISKVKEKERYFVAVAFLSDFFDLASESMPSGKVCF